MGVTAPMLSLALVLLAYAGGCFNAGYYLVRWIRHEDIRRHNSGSAGARNAGRLLGPWGFYAVFALDALKAGIAPVAARALEADPAVLPWLVPAAVAGHIWPVQLGFAGGKGIATAFGALLFLDVRLGALAFALPFLLYKLTGRLTWAGLAGLLVLPFLPLPAWSGNQAAALAAASVLVLAAHRGNLRQGGIAWDTRAAGQGGAAEVAQKKEKAWL